MTEEKSGVDQEVVRPESASLINSKNHRPGRELDALIAEKVFGTRVECSDHPSTRGEYYDLGRMRPGDNWPTVEIPHYSTDIEAAWRVVEKMKLSVAQWAGAWYAVRVNGWRIGPAEMQHYDGPLAEGDARWVEAETAPHAICLAALRALDA